MILAHFVGKKKWQIDARSRRRVEAFPNRKRSSAGYLAGGSYSSHSAAGSAAIEIAVRRTSIIRARNSRIGGRASLSYKSRACSERRDPSGEAHGTEQIDLHQPG